MAEKAQSNPDEIKYTWVCRHTLYNTVPLDMNHTLYNTVPLDMNHTLYNTVPLDLSPESTESNKNYILLLQ